MSDEKIEISVIMSVYNEAPDMAKKAIESILNQTFKKFEFIIIVDNPENNDLLKMIKIYHQDVRTKIIINQTNIGLAESLNRGIDIAKGKYIARMDADDISLECRLEKELEYLNQNPHCDLVYSDRIDINENGDELKTKRIIPKNDIALAKSLSYGSIITHPTVMMKSQIVKELNGYNNYYTSQDYDLWLRMRKAGCCFHFINEPLLYYRIRNNSISSTKGAIQFLSYYYAIHNDVKDLSFDLDSYREFIRKKTADQAFMAHFEKYRRAIEDKNVMKMLYLAVVNTDCRMKLFNSLLMHKFLM